MGGGKSATELLYGMAKKNPNIEKAIDIFKLKFEKDEPEKRYKDP